MGVGKNGKLVLSTNSNNSFSALENPAPLPIITKGFLAAFNKLIDFKMF